MGRRSRGFSLVEVLVSVVVLSLGVLGALGMQAASLQAGKEVRNQALAGSMARELAEKMRGNKGIAIANNNPYLMDLALPRNFVPTAASKNCALAACSAAEVASFDVNDWQLRMREALPSPRVRVCMDETPFTSAGLAQWTCSNSGTVAVLKLAWNRTNTQNELELTASIGAAPLPLLVLPLTPGSSQ